MARFNIWIGMDLEYQQDFVAFIQRGEQSSQFPAINATAPETVELFQGTHDAENVARLFKTWKTEQRDFRVWSFYFAKPENGQIIRDDIDRLNDEDPTRFLPMGAWDHDTGAEVGNPVWWPVPDQIINFMPDIMTDPGDRVAEPPVDPTYKPATAPTDVNLLYGQAPRDFSSFYG